MLDACSRRIIYVKSMLPGLCLSGAVSAVEAAEAAAAVNTVQGAVSRHHPAQLAPVTASTGILHTGALSATRQESVCSEQEYCTQEHPQWNMIPVMLCWLMPPVPAVTCVPPHSFRQWSSLAVFLDHHDSLVYGQYGIWMDRKALHNYRWCWHYIIVTNASKTFSF